MSKLRLTLITSFSILFLLSALRGDWIISGLSGVVLALAIAFDGVEIQIEERED